MPNTALSTGLCALVVALTVLFASLAAQASAGDGAGLVVPIGPTGALVVAAVLIGVGVTRRGKLPSWRAGQSPMFVALGVTVAVGLSVHLYLIFAYAPVEATMGIAQKIFYYHVPSAYSMYIGFTLALIGSIGYLWRRDPRWDALAVAGAEVGMVFVLVVLISGPLWARKAWGTYWTWDPRLTSTMMIGMVFMAFVVLRSFGAGGEIEKRFAAGLAIVGSFLIPIIHWSVQRWRGQHPTVVTGRGGGLHADMYPAFLTGMGVFTLLVIFLVWARYRAERTKHAVTALEDRLADVGMLEDA